MDDKKRTEEFAEGKRRLDEIGTRLGNVWIIQHHIGRGWTVLRAWQFGGAIWQICPAGGRSGRHHDQIWRI